MRLTFSCVLLLVLTLACTTGSAACPALQDAKPWDSDRRSYPDGTLIVLEEDSSGFYYFAYARDAGGHFTKPIDAPWVRVIGKERFTDIDNVKTRLDEAWCQERAESGQEG